VRYVRPVAHLLLTGATGMVGREILARAVTGGRYSDVSCLVRPSDTQSAQERLDQLCRRMGVPTGVRAIAGDVREPGLGVPARNLTGVTHVIHSAASVSFDLPIAQARAINVTGTANLLAACRRLPALERIDAISTCYVAGRRSGLVFEADLQRPVAGFHNTYEQTKFESEELLRAAMSDLPIAVHRPSIVVGDSRTGATGAWKVLYWPLKVIARGWLPVVPFDPDCTLDIVPVDFVADAVLGLAADAHTLGGTFHLAAGPDRDTTTGELFGHVFRLLERRPPMLVPPALFRATIRPALMLAPSPRLRRTLATGLVYRPYLELRLQFDTSGADRHLAPLGIDCPPVTNYIDTVVRTAIESDFGNRDGH